MDVAQDVIVHAEDCGTSNGITVHAIYDGDEEVASLSSRIYGRTSCERIVDPVSGEVIVDINDLIPVDYMPTCSNTTRYTVVSTVRSR